MRDFVDDLRNTVARATPPLTAVGDSVSGYRDGDTYRIMFSGFSANLFGTGNRFEGICMGSVVGSCP